MARFKIISALLLLVSSSLVVAQTAPNYGTYNADGTSTIYSTTNNYGPLTNLYDLYFADADTVMHVIILVSPNAIFQMTVVVM